MRSSAASHVALFHKRLSCRSRVDDGAARIKAMIATAGGAGDSSLSEYSPILSRDQGDPQSQSYSWPTRGSTVIADC